mgnify:CR=1 FL=1
MFPTTPKRKRTELEISTNNASIMTLNETVYSNCNSFLANCCTIKIHDINGIVDSYLSICFLNCSILTKQFDENFTTNRNLVLGTTQTVLRIYETLIIRMLNASMGFGLKESIVLQKVIYPNFEDVFKFFIYTEDENAMSALLDFIEEDIESIDIDSLSINLQEVLLMIKEQNVMQKFWKRLEKIAGSKEVTEVVTINVSLYDKLDTAQIKLIIKRVYSFTCNFDAKIDIYGSADILERISSTTPQHHDSIIKNDCLQMPIQFTRYLVDYSSNKRIKGIRLKSPINVSTYNRLRLYTSCYGSKIQNKFFDQKDYVYLYLDETSIVNLQQAMQKVFDHQSPAAFLSITQTYFESVNLLIRLLCPLHRFINNRSINYEMIIFQNNISEKLKVIELKLFNKEYGTKENLLNDIKEVKNISIDNFEKLSLEFKEKYTQIISNLSS